MNKRNVLVGVAIVVLIGVVVAILTIIPRVSNESSVTLGAVLPLTGDIASYGQAAKKGIDLAVDELNAEGGLDGRTIRVIYEDNQGQPARAVSAMQKLVSVDKVPAVMGAAASSVTMAICPIANREHVVLISPISSSPELTAKGGPYFFRVCPSDVVQAAMMAKWIKEDRHQTAAVIFINTSWGEGLKTEFVATFEAAGGKVLAVEGCKEGDRDLRAQLTKIKALSPDAIYGITHGREGGALLRQAKELGISAEIYGADVWGSPELRETAGDAAEGVKIIVPTKYETKGYSAFAERFKQRYGDEPDVYAAYSYDMMHFLANALKEANRGDPLRKKMLEMRYDGITGVTEFDENGDVVGKGFQRERL